LRVIICSAFTEKKPDELMHQVVKRGQFCELLAPLFGYANREAQSLFLTGMFSLFDAVLDLPMKRVFEEVPISKDIRKTILGEMTPYRDILDLVVSFEYGNWGKLNFMIKKHKLIDKEVINCHIKSIEWTENFVD